MQKVALDLKPGDEIEIDENWWIVRQHSFDPNRAAGIQMNLQGRDDPEFGKIVLTQPSFRYNTRPKAPAFPR